MTFLNPIWLLALPLIALPIIIHLLNQRRHRSIDWGAMQFLLIAKRMNRGIAKLRQVLIMAARMAAIAGLIFAVSRPLSTGWFGSLMGGKPESIIVLLDRSASMQQQLTTTGETKLKSGLTKIAAAIQTIGYDKPIVLIESCQKTPFLIDRSQNLIDFPNASPTETSSDVSRLLQTALDYVSENKTGRTDIWMLSDGSRTDWNPDNGRWRTLQSSFAKLEGVRFQVLNYSAAPTDNLAITVEKTELQRSPDKAAITELVIDLTVNRSSNSNDGLSLSARSKVPITFNINGLRSVFELELNGETAALTGHRIPIDSELQLGWGSVEIPFDENNSDNAAYFSFAPAPIRRTVIVTDQRDKVQAIELAAATIPQAGLKHEVQLISPEKVTEIDWQQTALLVWQAPLPEDNLAKQLYRFVETGRSVIFLPPAVGSDQSFAGWRWGNWSEINRQGKRVEYWNADEDLLARTRDGQALTLNELVVYQHAQLIEDQIENQTSSENRSENQTNAPTGSENYPSTELAKLENGSPLLLRCKASGGTVYFLSTWPVPTHSSLDREGITLFVAIQRAIAKGIESVGAARQLEAGSTPALAVNQLPRIIAAEGEDLIDGRWQRAGVYGNGKQLLALNRPAIENRFSPLAGNEIRELMNGLDVQVVDDTVGSGRSLASEIWKYFLVLMGLALLGEAILCLPQSIARPAEGVNQSPVRAAA